MDVDNIKFQCSFCGLLYMSFGKLARHISVNHENVSGFFVTCVVRGCKNSYKSISSLKKHMQRVHTELLSVSVCGSILADNNESTSNELTPEMMDDLSELETVTDRVTDADDDTCSSVAEMLNIFHKQFTLLMLCAREIHILPAVVQS